MPVIISANQSVLTPSTPTPLPTVGMAVSKFLETNVLQQQWKGAPLGIVATLAAHLNVVTPQTPTLTNPVVFPRSVDSPVTGHDITLLRAIPSAVSPKMTASSIIQPAVSISSSFGELLGLKQVIYIITDMIILRDY